MTSPSLPPYPAGIRPWVFTCARCHASELKRLPGAVGLSYPCPLCGGDMERNWKSSIAYQRKEAEAN
jgi:hypothetical protein